MFENFRDKTKDKNFIQICIKTLTSKDNEKIKCPDCNNDLKNFNNQGKIITKTWFCNSCKYYINPSYFIKTKKEIENLKEIWLKNPRFNLEDYTGFEFYKDILLKFRLEKEFEFERERERIDNEIKKKAKYLSKKINSGDLLIVNITQNMRLIRLENALMHFINKNELSAIECIEKNISNFDILNDILKFERELERDK